MDAAAACVHCADDGFLLSSILAAGLALLRYPIERRPLPWTPGVSRARSVPPLANDSKQIVLAARGDGWMDGWMMLRRVCVWPVAYGHGTDARCHGPRTIKHPEGVDHAAECNRPAAAHLVIRSQSSLRHRQNNLVLVR